MIAKLSGVAAAVLLAASTHASVTMGLSSATAPGGAYYASEEGSAFDATLTGYGTIVSTTDLIGIYKFTVSPGGSPSLGTSYYATCISPLGGLSTTPATYNQENFATAAPGINPPDWAGGQPAQDPVDGGYGIQNANYLYNNPVIGASAIIATAGPNGGNATADAEGAALALAMYTVLYNSTGLGTYDNAYSALGGPIGPFKITGRLVNNAAVYADYKNDLNYVSGMESSTPVEGGVLVPAVSTGQDLILIGGYQNANPVPEPTTIIAGALLLLPFGASTLRIIRRKSAV